MSESDPKRVAIHIAAIAEFSQRGFRGTSMANIADAAGMSRPALYQYFRDKTDIFTSAFVALFDEQANQAVAELHKPGTIAEQLDGFLQRYDGDLWERMAASPHSEELVSAKSDDVLAGLQDVGERLWTELAAYLAIVAPGRSASSKTRRAEWIDLLRLSPKGFKFDEPSIATFRTRLTTLARGVAADVEATQ